METPLGIDPFVYLRETLVGIYALGEKPTAEQLAAWLPDRWMHMRRESPLRKQRGEQW